MTEEGTAESDEQRARALFDQYLPELREEVALWPESSGKQELLDKTEAEAEAGRPILDLLVKLVGAQNKDELLDPKWR